MENKPDFFQKKLSNTRSFSRQKQTSHIRIILFIIIFIVLGLVSWKIFWAPANLNDTQNLPEEPITLSLGQEIYLKGNLRSDGDFTTHTHTLQDSVYGLVGLKSNEINLSDYVGFVELSGIVEKFNQTLPIVRVSYLSGVISEENDTDIVLNEKSGVYIMGAGIQFLPSFFDKYVLLNEGENGEILIQNIDSGEEISINYFRCNTSDPNRNCKGLTETFANNAAQSFVTAEGDIFYKQSEVQSRFVANGDWWGIFINDVSDDIIFELKDLIKFANKSNMEERIKSRAIKICQGSGEKMQKIEESNISLKQEGLIADIYGIGENNHISCQVLVDFSLPNKGSLYNFEIIQGEIKESDSIQDELGNKAENDDKKDTDNNTNQNSDNGDENNINFKEWNPNVTQFPIKDNGLTYTSNRGQYILNFPSSNISYVASSIKENFNQSDLSCSYVINVIKYSEKANLEISPAIRIYECSSNKTINSWAENYIIYNTIGKVFVVQINDSSWIDFSKNLKFSSLNN